MHELGITQSIVELAAESARGAGATRVVAVTVEVGALAGVVPDALAFCYDACSAGTLLEGSRLIVREIPGLGRCGDCGAAVPLDPYTVACSACGSFALERLQGEELRLTEVEFE